jgi:anti-anti-sigma factor
MEIDLSFDGGIPVLTLAGRFDGAGAALFDQRTAAVDSEAVQWVIDMSGVGYLSSLGIRSLVVLEKRLKARGGGLVLAGITPLVEKVIEVSGLESILSITGTRSRAVHVARTAAATAPAIELTFGQVHATVRRLAAAESAIEWWVPDSVPGFVNELLTVEVRDLGFAFGTGILGDPAGLETPRPFISTPHFAGMSGGHDGAVSDFVVGDASQVVSVAVASAWGLPGTAAAIVDLEGSAPFELLDALDELFDRAFAPPSPPALGFVVLAHVDHELPGLYAAAIAFDPGRALAGLDPAKRLDAAPGQIGLFSGRRFLGTAVTLNARPALERSSDVRSALRRDAVLETLGAIAGLDECARVTRARVWVFAPKELRSGVDKLLEVTIEGGGEWRPEWDAIIRRLYHDCGSVTLTPLPGGFMSSTFKAVAYDHDGRRTLPSVVKIGPVALTRREQQANREYVSRFILTNGTSVLGDAQQGDWAGLRYNFLGVNGPESRLVWLYEQYLQRPIPDVLALLERLFTGVLKPWYAQPRWEQLSLYREHSPMRLFPSVVETAEEVLGISADAPEFDCHELGVSLPTPFRFLKYEYPKRAAESRLWYTAVTHGDLNLRNVLVDERDNLYVIDFSETRPRNAVSDFARLEPVLKFEMTRIESDEDVRRLVEYEEGLASVSSLDEAPPFRYTGDDPLVSRAHAAITLLRRYADRATLFELDVIPYWIAMLEWTYSVVCYRQVTPRHKRYAACSAALICRSILRLENRTV